MPPKLEAFLYAISRKGTFHTIILSLDQNWKDFRKLPPNYKYVYVKEILYLDFDPLHATSISYLMYVCMYIYLHMYLNMYV